MWNEESGKYDAVIAFPLKCFVYGPHGHLKGPSLQDLPALDDMKTIRSYEVVIPPKEDQERLLFRH